MADNPQVGTIGWIDMTVDDEVLDASAAACVEKGGAVIVSPGDLAGGRFCVICDPAGSTVALYRP
jgi:predicted enzyme related to lactoylglutathione lyase